MDFHGFRRMGSVDRKARRATPIEIFSRFQAGFLPSEDFHRISCIFLDLHEFFEDFIYFHRFLYISIDFNRFHRFRGMGSLDGKARPAAPIETFPRFQAAFLSSEDFHRILWIFLDFYEFS